MHRIFYRDDAEGVQLLAETILNYIKDPDCTLKCSIYHDKNEKSLVMVVPSGIWKKKEGEV